MNADTVEFTIVVRRTLDVGQGEVMRTDEQQVAVTRDVEQQVQVRRTREMALRL